MLQVKNLKKEYVTGDLEQVALNDVSISFRQNEFVAILGPSGSGKTTLLNIIGGLDRYDSGDIIINNISTKNYTDKDWDSYRNHSVGFIFQNYNLIGHQSLLSNVELALTLSGVNKKERRKLAQESLNKVGLGEQSHKKPNQLSGGQMQRVAIARALVNNPDIILADEPTGALDTETSIQIMELLKEVSKTKLVIMVTHNDELAENYANRIVKIKDGNILNDTNPYNENQIQEEIIEHKNMGKSSMNFRTSLALSFNNLKTKKGRTLLTALAGSIGIIGIALILSISNGANKYIETVQQDTLTSYPITIQQESKDMNSMMATMMGINSESEDIKNEKHPNDGVYGNPIMYRMMNSMLNSKVNKNNMTEFKKYLDSKNKELQQITNAIQYGYDIDLNVYAKDNNGEYAKADFTEIMDNVVGGEGESSFITSASSMIENMKQLKIWQELLTDPKTGKTSSLITEQYDLVYGDWPSEKNELLLVLTPNNEISDLTLYSLGLVDKETMLQATMAAMTGKEDHSYDSITGKHWTYEEICNIPLKMILPSDYYRYDNNTKLWVDISQNQALMDTVINNGLELKVKGIVKPKEDAQATINGSLCYTKALTDYYVKEVNNSEIVKEQKENTNNNIISGLPFIAPQIPENINKAEAFREYALNLSNKEKLEIYKSILSTPDDVVVQDMTNEIKEKYEDKTTTEIINDIKNNYSEQIGYSPELIEGMLKEYSKEELLSLIEDTAKQMIAESYKNKAEKIIEDIKRTPSETELEKTKAILSQEIFKSIEGLEEPQKHIAAEQIKMGYIVSDWSSHTSMTKEMIINQVMSMEIDKVFNDVLTVNAIKVFGEHPEMGSDLENLKKIEKAFDEFINNANETDLVFYYDNNMPENVSDVTYNDMLLNLGLRTTDNPTTINIYPKSFEEKETIANMINEYNERAKENDKIEYIDYMAVIMSSVSTIIKTISIVLICFVSISLIVSSIMIGIITYISVLERTKEIGILRAIGASKRNVSQVFNAETLIIGFMSGCLGIIVSLILILPANVIIHNLTNIETINAILNPTDAVWLITLSVILTLIGGFIPAKKAAKKDPVLALRSE